MEDIEKVFELLSRYLDNSPESFADMVKGYPRAKKVAAMDAMNDLRAAAEAKRAAEAAAMHYFRVSGEATRVAAEAAMEAERKEFEARRNLRLAYLEMEAASRNFEEARRLLMECF